MAFGGALGRRCRRAVGGTPRAGQCTLDAGQRKDAGPCALVYGRLADRREGATRTLLLVGIAVYTLITLSRSLSRAAAGADVGARHAQGRDGVEWTEEDGG